VSDVEEKLAELQEGLQKLQLLKGIGAKKLIAAQEREIYRIQQEILDIDENKSMDVVHALLPKKCWYCNEKETEDERLQCFEDTQGECDQRKPEISGVFSLNLIRLVVIIALVLFGLFSFLLLTNILLNYLPDYKWIVFGICILLTSLIGFLLRKPIKSVFKSL
jgi:hypothetical protein